MGMKIQDKTNHVPCQLIASRAKAEYEQLGDIRRPLSKGQTVVQG